MKKKDLTLQNFSYGVVSNYGDFSNGSYYHSAKKINNMLITPYGFLTRRPPSSYNHKINNNALKIISFNDNNNIITIECYAGYFIMYINDAPYNFTTPIANNYTSEDIANLTYAEDQENILIYLFTPQKPPLAFKYRQRIDLPNYSVMTYDLLFVDGPYEAMNTNSTITITPEATSGYGKKLVASFGIFALNDVGRYVAILYNGVWGCGKIKSYIDAKNVLIDILTPFLAITPTINYKFSIWGAKNGYPSFGVIFEGRLCFASCPKFSKSLWISQYGNYTSFSNATRMPTTPIKEEILATNSITINLDNQKSILWLHTYKNSIIVGTNKGIYMIKSNVSGEWISPLNYGIFEISDDVCSNIVANKNGLLFYVDSYKKTIYALSVIMDKVFAINIRNITNKAQHLFTSGIKNIKLIEYPFKMLWVLLNNGELLCASIINNDGQYIYAWHSHKIGGNGCVEQISGGDNNSKSMLFLLVSRTINSVLATTSEIMEFGDFYSLLNDNILQVYLDGRVITKMVSGINPRMGDHTGKTLSLWLKDVDVYMENFTIINVNQSIDGNYLNQDVYWGYPYESKIVSNDLDDAQLFGEYKAIDKIHIKTIKTKEIKYSTSKNNAKNYVAKNIDMTLDSSVNVYQLDIQTDFSKVKNLTIWQNNHTHLNISYIKINMLAV
jgi:hypothetical protein